MKYIDEFRDGRLAQAIGAAIGREVDPARQYNLMEFCGGHTHAIARYGLPDLLPRNVRMIHGPGCPVCVLPVGRIDNAIEIASQPNVILCSFGDTLRVPASGQMSLLKAKARGLDIRMVYSSLDAVAIAQQHPDKQVVFFAIGFETTTPTTAVAVKKAEALGLGNFTVFCNHVLTPAALDAILATDNDGGPATLVHGVVGPAHVSTVIGSAPYEAFTARYRKPLVIAGFEPLDVLQAVRMLVRQLNEGRAEVENEYTRTVTKAGNRKAQAMVEDMFELRASFEWRGLGEVPWSALQLRERYRRFDAEARFHVEKRSVADAKACECGTILRGLKEPKDCKIFGTVCTPDNPVGACMVSSEGACAAYYTYGRFTIPIAQVAA
jgi:hydrogenase expression/formation protein HypD